MQTTLSPQNNINMEPYVHDPDLYRKHFIGYGLDGFSGTRIQQRGRGRGWWRQAKRYAIPLLKAGARIALPHVSRALKHAAGVSAAHLFPGNTAIQSAIGHMTDHVTKRLTKKTGKLLKNTKSHKTKQQQQNKRKRSSSASRGAKRNRTRSSSIFD